MRSPARAPLNVRAFTLAEIAVVVAMIGIAMAIGFASLVDMVRVQQRNAAVALANLEIREARATALAQGKARYIKPDIGGGGVVIGSATINASGQCADGPVEKRVDLGTVNVSGSRICFTKDGTTDDDQPQGFDFIPPGGGGTSVPFATVAVYPAGSVKWTSDVLNISAAASVSTVSVKKLSAAQVMVAQ